MHLDLATRYALARYLAGAESDVLDAITSPIGRALALAITAIEQAAKHPSLAHKPQRHDAVAIALRQIAGDQAERLQAAILAVDPTAPLPTEPRARSIGEILSDPAAAPTFVVQNRLPVGLSILSGRPKVGKSWLILDVAAAVAQGLPVLGVTNVEQAPAMVWALEDNWGRIQARAFRQGIPRGIPLYFRTKPARLPECVADLRQDFEEYRPRLFVIDTLSRIIPPGASLNDSGQMAGALDAVQQMAFEYDACVLLVHHQRKNNEGGDHLDAVLGATGITGVADAIFSLTRQRGDENAQLAITGRDIEGELTLGLSWNHDRCKWDTWEQGELIARRPKSLGDLIRDAIRELGTGDAQAIAEKIGKDRSTVTTELKAMRERGELQAITAKGQGRRLLYSIPGGLSDAEDEPEDGPVTLTDDLADLTPQQREENRRAQEEAIEQTLRELDEEPADAAG